MTVAGSMIAVCTCRVILPVIVTFYTINSCILSSIAKFKIEILDQIQMVASRDTRGQKRIPVENDVTQSQAQSSISFIWKSLLPSSARDVTWQYKTPPPLILFVRCPSLPPVGVDVRVPTCCYLDFVSLYYHVLFLRLIVVPVIVSAVPLFLLMALWFALCHHLLHV